MESLQQTNPQPGDKVNIKNKKKNHVHHNMINWVEKSFQWHSVKNA